MSERLEKNGAACRAPGRNWEDDAVSCEMSAEHSFMRAGKKTSTRFGIEFASRPAISDGFSVFGRLVTVLRRYCKTLFAEMGG